MLNCISTGQSLNYTNNTAKDIKSGDIVVIESVVGVAITDIVVGLERAVAIVDVYALPKAAVAINQGAKLYYDVDADPVGGTAGTGALTTTAEGNVYAGKAMAAAAGADTTVQIKLNV